MDGCATEIISTIRSLSRPQIRKLLQSETKELEVTKSLLNLLYNIIVVGSVPVSPTQKSFFDEHVDVTLHLLGKRSSLKSKKKLLEDNLEFVINIATSCPTVAGSSSLKTVSNNSVN